MQSGHWEGPERLALKIYLGAVVVLVAGIVAGFCLFWVGPFSPENTARRELELRVGPLNVSSLRVSVPPRGENAALVFAAAGDQVEVDDEDRRRLEDFFDKGQEAAGLESLVERNRRAIEAAAAARGRSGCSLSLDYTADPVAPDPPPKLSGEIPDRLREETLAALIALDARRAFYHNDSARALRSFQLLGQLAECLERETALSFQVRGATIEMLQQRVLRGLLRERTVPLDVVRQLSAALPQVDNREQLRRALRYEAIYSERHLRREELAGFFTSQRLAGRFREVSARLDTFDSPADHVVQRRFNRHKGYVMLTDCDPATLKIIAQLRAVARLAIAWRLKSPAPGACASSLPRLPLPDAGGVSLRSGELKVREEAGECSLVYEPAGSYAKDYSAASGLDPGPIWQIPALPRLGQL